MVTSLHKIMQDIKITHTKPATWHVISYVFPGTCQISSHNCQIPTRVQSVVKRFQNDHSCTGKNTFDIYDPRETTKTEIGTRVTTKASIIR